MNRLETLNGETLTIMCTDISLPLYESIKVENKLLDGSLHIQTIGNPLKKFQIEVVCTKYNAEKINEMVNTVEEIYFFRESKRYRGIIRNQINWTKIEMYKGNVTKYKGEIEFVVFEEGSI